MPKQTSRIRFHVAALMLFAIVINYLDRTYHCNRFEYHPTSDGMDYVCIFLKLRLLSNSGWLYC